MKEWQREAVEHGRDPKLKENDVFNVNMTWLNSNPNVVIEADDKQQHYFTYGESESNANCFKKITYELHLIRRIIRQS